MANTLIKVDGKIVRINLGTVLNYLPVVNSEVDFNDNRLKVVAGSTRTIDIDFFMINGDRMLITAPQYSGLDLTFSIPVNAGDSVYIVPESGDWDNLKTLDFDNNDLIFDLSDLDNKINFVTRIFLNRNSGITGDIIYLSTVTERITLNGTGTYGSINTLIASQVLFLNCPNIGGSLNFISVSVQLFLISQSITGVLFDVAGGYCIVTSPLVTGTLSTFTSNYSNLTIVGDGILGDTSDLTGTYGNLQLYCELITGTSSDFVNVTTSIILRSPLIVGSLSNFAHITTSVDVVGTNISTYTTTTWNPLKTYWHDLATVPDVLDINQLLSDQVARGKTSGESNIGGTNPPITTTQALADIATLQGLSWIITYNS